MIKDDFFGPWLVDLNIDFVTYEPFYDIHALTNIRFGFPQYGFIDSTIRTRSMRLDTIQNVRDIIYLGLTALYVVLFVVVIYALALQLLEKHKAYWKWKKFEVDYLTEVERDQRNKKKPEFMRYLKVMLDGFTVINLAYTIMTAWSLGAYIRFSMEKR